MRVRVVAVAGLSCLALAGCTGQDAEVSDGISRSDSSEAPVSANAVTQPPVRLTCATDLRQQASPPFRDGSEGGSRSAEQAVESWLAGPLSGGRYGPDFVLDDSMGRAWILREDGTAEARVRVDLLEGGYFVETYFACASTA
ncbi:hypothetical protein GCM10027020_04790 [Nocardioides salsibiostraticola]